MSPKPQKAAARMLVVRRKRGAAKGATSCRRSEGVARRSVGVPCDQATEVGAECWGTVPGCAGLCWTRVPIL